MSRGGPPGLPLAGDSALMADTVCGGDGVAEEAGCSARLLSGALAAGAGKHNHQISQSAIEFHH